MPLRRLLPTTCALLLLVAGPLAAAETEHFQRTVPLAPGGTLKLHNFSGRVTITGTDRAEVAITATRTAPRDRLDRIKLDVTVSGTTVEIQANKKVSSAWSDLGGNNVVDTEMEIHVPRHTNLDIDVFSSPVVVTNVEGTHRAHAFSADIRMAGVNGPVKADTFSGRIDVELGATAVGPNLNLKTFSGDIDVRLPQAARASVEFHSFSGDLATDYPMTLRTKDRHSLRGDLSGGAPDASITIETFSGDARILKPR